MLIDILTLFPNMFVGPFDESMIKRAQEKKLASIQTHQLRKWAIDRRGTVDGHPFGGGAGMILRPEPIFCAVDALKKLRMTCLTGRHANDELKIDKKTKAKNNNNETMKSRREVGIPIEASGQSSSKVILLDAGGSLFNQQKAEELSHANHLIFICGHYEGVDYRVHEHLADEVLSIGNFVLTGGELPTMLMIDSIVRLIPGVLNKEEATRIESFSTNNQLPITNNEAVKPLLEFPQYTRPEEYRGYKVPEILRSGNHKEIEKWRETEAKKRTQTNRPDL